MTIFDLTFKQLLWILLMAFTIIIIFPHEQAKPKETRVTKTVRILDKKWDKWIKRNEHEILEKK